MSHSRSLFLVVFASMFYCASANAASTIEEEMSDVRKTANWPAIKATADRLLERNPNSPYCIATLVEADIQLKLYDDARANLLRLRRDFGQPQPYLWALLEYLQGNYKEADKYVALMLSEGSQNSNILQLSESIVFKIDRDRWMHLVAKNRKMENSKWYFSRGTSGDHEKALAELRKFIKAQALYTNEFIISLVSLVPKNKLTPDEIMMVAKAHFALDHEDGIVEWCESVALEKPREILKIMDGTAFRGFKNHERVRMLLDKMEATCKNDSHYWLIRSCQASQEGRHEDAMRYCLRSIEIKPDEQNLWLHFSLDRQSAATKKDKDAHSQLLDDLKPLVERYPSVRVYKERAKVFHENGQDDEEVGDLAHLIEIMPPGEEQLKTRIRKAEVEYVMGDLRAAKKTVTTVLKIQPGNARAVYLMSAIQKEMKRASLKD